jgi:hypothetical protein
MNREPLNDDPEPLQRVLKDWRVETPLPPRFQAQVWTRIAARESAGFAPWKSLTRWLEQLALRPAFAVSYASLLLVIGLGAGLWQSHQASRRNLEAMSARYVQMVDPYQMPRF